jgi:hypothetical protein
MLQYIHQGLLESAFALLVGNDSIQASLALESPIKDCLKHANTLKNAGNIRQSIQYQRRATSLTMLRDTGRLSGTVIPSVVLPERYCGKIMLAWAEGVCLQGRTFLRSGDDWHREILRSFEAEMQDYGFENFQITPKGGAFVHFQTDGTVALSGSSEEFGRCSREEALQLVQTAFPDRTVYWSETADLQN